MGQFTSYEAGSALNKMHDCEHHVSQNAAWQATRWEERDPLSELEVITTLLFSRIET
jgi:hypothetical protein